MTQRDLGMEGFVLAYSLWLRGREVRLETRGRKWEAGTEAEASKDPAYWLVPQDLPSLLPYTPQNHRPRHDSGPSELGPSINKFEENTP